VIEHAIDYHSDRVGPARDRALTYAYLGDDVARAKRTERAEARRQYRAFLAQQDTEAAQAAAESGGASAAPAKVGATRTRGSDAKPQSGNAVSPGARMGIAAAARAAYRQPHYMDDLRNIRPLVFNSNTIWPILAMCAVAGVYSVVRISSGEYVGDPILSMVFSFLFFPVPLVPPMLAGFLAPRATWLAGAIASFIATMTVVTVFALTGAKLDAAGGIAGASASPSTPATSVATESASPGSIALASLTLAPTSSVNPSPSAPSASPSGSSSTSDANSNGTTNPLTATLVLLPESVAFGFLMGALSGWYKRFLALTSGPRRAPTRSASRPAKRRPPTKRT
jgi:hypothetical protein